MTDPLPPDLSVERIEELQAQCRNAFDLPQIRLSELSALLSLAHSAASGSEWRPIESYEGGFVWLGFDDIQHAEKGRYCDDRWRNNYAHAFSGAPSHWMPLPAPPTNPPPPTKKEPENG